jgi:hypothetical protein
MTLQDIDDLEARIHGLEMPEAPFALGPGMVIEEMEKFIQIQLFTLRSAPEAKTSLPCLWRLEKFIELVEAKQGERE